MPLSLAERATQPDLLGFRGKLTWSKPQPCPYLSGLEQANPCCRASVPSICDEGVGKPTSQAGCGGSICQPAGTVTVWLKDSPSDGNIFVLEGILLPLGLEFLRRHQTLVQPAAGVFTGPSSAEESAHKLSEGLSSTSSPALPPPPPRSQHLLLRQSAAKLWPSLSLGSFDTLPLCF